MTNNQPPLGQRLKAWREANGLSVEETAQRLGCQCEIVNRLENHTLWPVPELGQQVEALIAANPDHDAIVEAATAAIRAALEAGATSVHIRRPETPTGGRVTVILGDDDDEDWKKWI
jgi:transcriptional regulator with XRE-family HTH domain